MRIKKMREILSLGKERADFSRIKAEEALRRMATYTMPYEESVIDYQTLKAACDLIIELREENKKLIEEVVDCKELVKIYQGLFQRR